MLNDNSIPFEEEFPIRNIKSTFITDIDGITRVIFNGSYTSDASNRLLSGNSDELVSKLTDPVIQTLIKDHFYESVKGAVRDSLELQTVNLERLECTYTTQVELEYRIKPVIKNDDLDLKKWHKYSEYSRNEAAISIKEKWYQHSEYSRNEVQRSIKEMLEDNRKEY